VQFETERYRAESNPVGMFVQAATIEEAAARSPATRLSKAYENWCRANAIEPRSQKWFGDRMSDLGIKREQIGVTYYCDIRLVREAFGEVTSASNDEEELE
jgi:phage/plasmid-associated DNA primase